MLSIFLFGYAIRFFDYLSGLLPESMRTLPDWSVYGWNYVLSAVRSGIHLLSWLFPNQGVYVALVGLSIDVAVFCIGMKFFHTISNFVNRFKTA